MSPPSMQTLYLCLHVHMYLSVAMVHSNMYVHIRDCLSVFGITIGCYGNAEVILHTYRWTVQSMMKCNTARLWLCMRKTSGFVNIVQVTIYLEKHSQLRTQCETGTHHKTSVSQGTNAYMHCRQQYSYALVLCPSPRLGGPSELHQFHSQC